MMKKILTMMVLVLFLASSTPLIEARPVQSFSGVRPQLVQEYNEVKDQYKNTKQDWEQARTEYMKTKQALSRTGELKPTGQLEQDQEQHVSRIKDFLLKTVERMERHIQILQKWTEIVVYNEELKEEILYQLEKDLNELKTYENKIKEASTVQELRAIGKELKEFWKDVRGHLKKYHGIILSAKIGRIIERSERLSESLHKRLSELDENHPHLEEMKYLLEDFDENVASAKESYEKAKDLYIQIRSIEDAKKLFEEIKTYLKEAHKYLKEAHKSLRHLVKIYKDSTGEFPRPSLEANIQDIDTTGEVEESNTLSN